MTGNRVWMLGVTLAAVVIVALGWLFAISPTLAQADLASSQAANTTAQNAAQRIALAKLKGQYDRLPELKADLTKLQIAVPETVNLDDFLDQLQQLAQSTGVTITTFTAAEATPYGGAEAAAASAAASGASSSSSTTTDAAKTDAAKTASGSGGAAGVKTRLFSIPISIAVSGSPEQVMAFTDASQKGQRFFLVTTDTFTGSRDHPTDDGGTLTGFVFVVRDTPAAVVPAK